MGLVTGLLGTLASLAGLSGQVLRDRIALSREQAKALEDQMAKLEKENADLRRQVSEFEEEQGAMFVAEKFVEHHGALFKRNPSGDYQRAVFCPTCRISTNSFQGVVAYRCPRCHWMADFKAPDLDAIMAELP